MMMTITDSFNDR